MWTWTRYNSGFFLILVSQNFIQMRYHFVVNARADKAFIQEDLKKQLSGLDINYDIYLTRGEGEATRHVRLHSEFNQKEEVCFVACGGSGTMNEVAAGLVGAPHNHHMAFLAYGTTNDFTKSFPGRDFTSVAKILEAETKEIDIIKCNDDYSLNLINIGFDAMVGYHADQLIKAGKPNPYNRALIKAIVGNRYNRMKIFVDGERVGGPFTLLCSVANASYCGGQFYASPESEVDDGTIEVIRFHPCTFLAFGLMIDKYRRGVHFQDDFCMRHIDYRRGKHIEVSAKHLFYACLDGEMYPARKFVIDVVPKAISFCFPPLEKTEEQ